jgi:hypothetical protein
VKVFLSVLKKTFAALRNKVFAFGDLQTNCISRPTDMTAILFLFPFWAADGFKKWFITLGSQSAIRVNKRGKL